MREKTYWRVLVRLIGRTALFNVQDEPRSFLAIDEVSGQHDLPLFFDDELKVPGLINDTTGIVIYPNRIVIFCLKVRITSIENRGSVSTAQEFKSQVKTFWTMEMRRRSEGDDFNLAGQHILGG
jgi:hypothetical protein